MPLDEIPDGIVLPTRDKIRDDYCRDYKLRVPAADVGPKTQPYNDASVFADAQMVAYNDARALGAATNLRGKSTAALDEFGARITLPRGEATGAAGYVEARTATGGTTLFAGDELINSQSGLRYKVTVAGLYLDRASVPVAGIDTGPSTNLVATRVLEFSSPRPGCAQRAAVVAQSDGSGLTGGRNRETNEEYVIRIEDRLASPPASGNESEVILRAESTPGVAIQKAFVTPAALGPATKAVTITLRPIAPGGSRIPNAAHLAALLSYLVGAFPGDDGILVASLFSQLVAVGLRVTWQQGVPGWVDAIPWPEYDAATQPAVTVSTPSTNTVRVAYSASISAPVVGQTIAFYDKVNARFARKRIGAVSAGPATSSDITFSDVLGASDTSLFPAVGALASPWSESLNEIPKLVAGEFDKLGPGEQFASFVDPGRRQRREPPSPSQWPSVLTNRIARPVLDLALIADVDLVLPTLPFASTVGTPGVASYLLELGDLAVWAL